MIVDLNTSCVLLFRSRPQVFVGQAPWPLGRLFSVQIDDQGRNPKKPNGQHDGLSAGRMLTQQVPLLFETMPSVAIILMAHYQSFEDAITRAILDTRDNDTIASIVGAVLGALHGKKAVPDRWLKRLSGRTRGFGHHDDGAVFRLIDHARTLWG